MAKIEDGDYIYDWQDYFIPDAYTSFSSFARRVNETSYPGRSGKVKRAPNLAEYEQDDNYYSGDDSYYEDRK